MRTRAYRRHQEHRHMMRRLKEDWNQHYDRPNYIDGEWVLGREQFGDSWITTQSWEGSSSKPSCPCFTDPKEQARFKEQPARGPSRKKEYAWFSGPWMLTRQEKRYTRRLRTLRELRPIDEFTAVAEA